MGQEFFINSQQLENKIRQLLPSQGGAGAGIDLSASTQIIPIIDVTESAEGSNLRADLQSAIDLNVTAFDINNSVNTDIITSTGFFRLFGIMTITTVGSGDTLNINMTDGTTTKTILNGKQALQVTGVGIIAPILFDFVIKVSAGESIRATANATNLRISGTAK